MINYTISDFFGIFFIGLPVLVFATTIMFWGIRQMMDRFFEEPEDEDEDEDESDGVFLEERKRRLRF
jgi:hypothetical protein